MAEWLAQNAGIGMTSLVLLLAALYLRKGLTLGAVIASWMRTAIVVIALIGVASAFGVIDIHADLLVGGALDVLRWLFRVVAGAVL